MGLRVSKVSASGHFGYRFRGRYRDFGHRSRRSGTRCIVLSRILDGPQHFEEFVSGDFGHVFPYPLLRFCQGARGIVTMFCEELWMGLRISKVPASGDFGSRFRVRHGNLEHRSRGSDTRDVVLLRIVDGPQTFEEFCVWGLWL